MEPALSAGDLALARTVPADEVDPGDIVGVTDNGVHVTHRVVSVRTENGVTALTLKGDANDSVDASPYAVTEADRVFWHVPGIGRVVQAAGSPVGIGLGLALLAACLILGRRPRVTTDDESEGGGSGSTDAQAHEERAAPRARRALAVLALIPLSIIGSTAAPEKTLAYFTDTPTIRTPSNGLDAAPWFTCGQTATALSAFAYYRFNDPVLATVADDSTSNNRDASLSLIGTRNFGSVQSCAREGDTGLELMGAGYAATPEVSNQGGPPGARWNVFTVSIWFRGNALSAAGGVLMAMGSASDSLGRAHDRFVYVDSSGRLRFGVYTNRTHTLVTPAPGQPGYHDYRDQEWHLATATLSPQGMKLYVNGVQQTFATTEQGNNPASITSAYQYASAGGVQAYWMIGGQIMGGWPRSAGTAFYWTGYVNDVGIWDRALTDQEIRDLYRSAIPVN